MGVVRPKKQTKKKSSGGGFFHHVFHPPVPRVIKQTVKDVGNIAMGAPGGVVQTGRDLYLDVVHPRPGTSNMDAIVHPLRGIQRTRTYHDIIKPGAIATKEEFQHPLRHPGYTLFSALAAVNPALRAGRVARGATVAKADEQALLYAAGAAHIHMRTHKSPGAAASSVVIPEHEAVKEAAQMLKLPEKKMKKAYHAIGPAMKARREAENLAGGVGSLPAAEAAIYDEAVSSAAKAFAHGWERTLVYSPKTKTERKKWERSGVVEPLPKKGPDILQKATELGIPTVGSTAQSSLQHLRPHREILADIEKALGPPVIRASVPRSRVPTTQGFQSALDALTDKSHSLNRYRVKKVVSRELDLAGRKQAEVSPGIVGAWKTLYPTKESKRDLGHNARMAKASLRSADKELNAIIRGVRLYRPGYIAPNLVGSVAANLTHMHGRFRSNQKAERFIRKNYPEAAAQIDKRMGETTAQAAADVGKLDPEKHLPAQTLARGVGTSMGKVVDRRSRARAFVEEAKRRHPDWSDEDIVKYLDHPAMIPEMNRINDVAEKEAINFSKNKPLKGFSESAISRVDRALSRNVFLWRWTLASSRYYGRVLKEHPGTTAGLVATTQVAPDLKNTLASYPSFMSSYIPWGYRKVTGKDMPTVLNPQAASIYNMPVEIAQTLDIASQGGERAIDVLHERLNPVQHGVGVFLRGRDPFRQQTVTAGKKGHRHPAPASRMAALAALRAELTGNPYTSLGRMTEGEDQRSRRLFPRSPEDIALAFLLGQIFVPSPVNPDIAGRMHTREVNPHGGGRKKKRSLGY